MKIKCWGVRGSIPVCGKEYLKYGGSTMCVEVCNKAGDTVIIDAGTGIRALGNKILAEEQNNLHLIFTHAHWDHLLGFPFFKPLYMSQTAIKIYGCSYAQECIRDIIAGAMKAPYFPVDYGNLNAHIDYQGTCNGPFLINSLKITPIHLSHPNQGLGYKFEEEGKIFVFLTDNELTYQHPGGLDFDDYVDFSSNADLLLHDAEFKRSEYMNRQKWGHSVYVDALQLALDARVKKFGLIHHNQERSDAELDEIEVNCREIIEEQNSSLECFVVYEGMEIQV